MENIEYPEQEITEEVSESYEKEVIVKKNEISYTFTCAKCGKVIAINSDMYSKVEDKKSQHTCGILKAPISQE